jgi:hypothetical protein
MNSDLDKRYQIVASVPKEFKTALKKFAITNQKSMTQVVCGAFEWYTNWDDPYLPENMDGKGAVKIDIIVSREVKIAFQTAAAQECMSISCFFKTVLLVYAGEDWPA